VAGDPSASELSFSLRGRLLLASPALADGTFDRSVIFMAEHSREKGAMGVIINHRSESTVGDIISDPALAPLHPLPVHQGGPLSTNELSFSCFSWNKTTGLEFKPHISPQNAMALMKKKTNLVRASVGHSAWSPGQLEDELQRNTWITTKPSENLLAAPHDLSLWQDLLKNISPYHYLLAQSPKNPFLN